MTPPSPVAAPDTRPTLPIPPLLPSADSGPPAWMQVRSLPLVVLATLCSIFVLYWAGAVFIPLMLGLLFSYGLSPVVDWLHARRVPRALGAALLLLGLVGGAGSAAYVLSDDAGKLIDTLPLAAQKLRQTLGSTLKEKPDNTLASVKKAAAQLERAAEEAHGPPPVSRGVLRVQIEKSRFALEDHLWTGTLGLLGVLSQIGAALLMCFFLMISGDRFRRKLVKLAGNTLSRKRITLQALNEINSQIQQYLLVQLITSVVVGVATWLCFLAIGLEHAAVWGIASGVLNLVPYFGGAILAGGSALVAFMQFGTLDMALLLAGASLLIHSLEGFLLMPWLTSRAGKMNPVAIFVGVMAWGWLWGPWGLLLGVPILMIVKAVCDRVEDLKPVGEFLGE